MTALIYIVLAWFGLALGSFVNALVWRLHEQEKGKKKAGRSKAQKNSSYSILTGRSACPNCGHTLAWYDLVPVASWLWLKGRCRYCKKPISLQYPLVEAAAALVFALSYALWPQAVVGWQWVPFITWLAAAVGLLALLVYDARWMLLPNRIIYPTLAVAAAGRLAYILGREPHKGHAFLLWFTSVVVASGIFAAIYYMSSGRLIGFGDVRLGLVTGTLLAGPAESFFMIFLASVLGVIFALPALLSGQKNLASRLPYGPFLIGATAVAVIYGPSVIDWYKRVFLP